MLQWWQAIVLGLVEGITEYLPVSSTGHLIVASSLMGLHKTPELKEAVNTFEIAIQGGAILAVLGLYFPRFITMLKGLIGRDNAGFMLLVNLIIAFIPAALLGLLLNSFIKKHFFNLPMVIIALLVGGVVMIVVDRWYVIPRRYAGSSGGGSDLSDLSPGGALKIGLLQCFALWPGTSRSMMTITGGVIAGLRPAAAAEFSFLLGMPTLLAATLYALYKNYKESQLKGTANMIELLGWAPVILGSAVAAISAAIAVKWLVGFLNRHGLTPFGIYRIAFGLILLGLLLSGVIG
jgi:undecaprenyl-diphosphatase